MSSNSTKNRQSVPAQLSTQIQPAQQPQQPEGSSNSSTTVATLMEPKLLLAVSNLDLTTRQYRSAIDSADGDITRGTLMGLAVNAIRGALTPEIMAPMMSLMNTPLGFMADRPSKKHPSQYPLEVVRDCLAEALILGFRPVGKEWMIMHGNFFGCQAGWERKLCEAPGVSNVEIIPGRAITLPDGRFGVRIAISWKMYGVADCLRGPDGKPGREYTLKMESYETFEQLTGKAVARALRAAYKQATNSTFLPTEAEDTGTESLLEAKQPEPLADRLADRRVRQEAYTRISELTRKLQLSPDEAEGICKSLDIPVNLQAASPEHIDKLQAHLEDLLAQDAEDKLREREAIQGR